MRFLLYIFCLGTISLLVSCKSNEKLNFVSMAYGEEGSNIHIIELADVKKNQLEIEIEDPVLKFSSSGQIDKGFQTGIWNYKWLDTLGDTVSLALNWNNRKHFQNNISLSVPNLNDIRQNDKSVIACTIDMDSSTFGTLYVGRIAPNAPSNLDAFLKYYLNLIKYKFNILELSIVRCHIGKSEGYNIHWKITDDEGVKISNTMLFMMGNEFIDYSVSVFGNQPRILNLYFWEMLRTVQIDQARFIEYGNKLSHTKKFENVSVSSFLLQQ